MNPSCSIKVEYSGELDNIFFWSHDTCLGDEIGWDFVNQVLSSHLSFSAFCDEMTRKYKSIDSTSQNFLSKTTFISWFFSWCSKMGIDFRRDVDPWCGHDPQVLACDGTHIGLSHSRTSIEPLEKSDGTSATIKPHHRRYDRVLLCYNQNVSNELVRQARSHLKNTCRRFLSLEHSTLSPNDKQRLDENVLLACPQEQECKNFLQAFFTENLSANYKQAAARFLLLLSADAPVSSVIPLRYAPVVLANATSLLSGSQPTENFSSFCPELDKLVFEAIALRAVSTSRTSQRDGFLYSIKNFINRRQRRLRRPAWILT